jgi:hypothetical protein
VPDGSNLEQRWGRGVTGEVVIDGKQLYKPGDRLCTMARMYCEILLN